MRAAIVCGMLDTPAMWSAREIAGRPLVVCLHGYSSDEVDVFAITDRLGTRPVFVAPRAPHRGAAPFGGFAWFPLHFAANGSILGGGDGPDDRAAAAAIGAEASEAARGLLGWLDEVEAKHGAPSSIGLVGFSQGGIVAAQALRMRPERFAATALLSSMVAPGELPGDAVLAATRPPLYLGYGALDPVIPAAATAYTRGWAAAHGEVTEHPEPQLGHELSNEQLATLASFLDEHLG